MFRIFFLFICAVFFLAGCKSDSSSGPLPIIGERSLSPQGDTIYPTVPAFKFTDQDNRTITNSDFDGNIYVVDFFFTHCTTICPKVTAQMKRVYDRFKDVPGVLLLSHTIDVRHDTVGRLKEYSVKLGVPDDTKWKFVTGDEDEIYKIANRYFSVAKRDPTTKDGFDHSGRLILVDRQKRVRSFCDGTNPEDVDRFMNDIQRLLSEK